MASKYDLETIRHSAAHLLAHAIQQLYPDTLFTIGPATEDGFFYDVLPTKNFKEEDLALIEQRMKELADKDYPINQQEITKAEARKLFKNNRFKLELIEGIPGETVGLAIQDDFQDLCRGGHVPSTGYLKNFKLLAISGSYWRADRKGQALQRIHGTAFATAEELADYERKQYEALQYDHRRLGKQLDLFSFNEEGIGFPFFHPKGKLILNLLVDYMRSLQRHMHYQEIETPTMLIDDLWKQSGHWSHYKENMFLSSIDEKSYAVKPMNCPGAILVYKSRPRSYRELPLRLSEFGHVHRYELSGVLHGLMRVRAFTQDDAHLFCTPDQIENEILTILTVIDNVLKRFSFNKTAKFAVGTRPEQSMGDNELWDTATTALKNALKRSGHEYTLNEGDGAFYGPKIDITIEDSLGRRWQCGTVQLDFNQPENFDLHYVSSDGSLKRPVMIHQAIYGSLERFMAILLEHYKGNLPLWLSPVQARILPITDAQRSAAEKLYSLLENEGVRVELDTSSDPLSGQIKRAQQEKIPVMIVLGKKEVENDLYTIRHRDGKQETGLTYKNLIELLKK